MLKNRAFLIGKRSKYGGSTRSLSKEDIDCLRKVLIKHHDVLVLDKINPIYGVEEMVTEYDRAVCRVIVTIHDFKYNIMNFNVKALREETALDIRNRLRSAGYQAAVEYLGKKSMVPRYRHNAEGIEKKEKTNKHPYATKIVEYEQCLMFDQI